MADAADGAIPRVAAEERGGGATRPPRCPRGAGLSWRRRRLSRVAWTTTGRPGKPRWRRGRPHHRGHRRRPTNATGSGGPRPCPLNARRARRWGQQQKLPQRKGRQRHRGRHRRPSMPWKRKGSSCERTATDSGGSETRPTCGDKQRGTKPPQPSGGSRKRRSAASNSSKSYSSRAKWPPHRRRRTRRHKPSWRR